MKLKILSFNIHKGISWHGLSPTLEVIRTIIRMSEADLVFLQEVHGENARNKKEWEKFNSQYEFLADEIWSHHCYAKNAVYDHGHHGNVILSKFPILNWQKLDISTNRFEKRGLLSAQIDLCRSDKSILHAHCVHLNLLPQGRKIQYQQIIKSLQASSSEWGPLIVAGDFNDWNNQAENLFSKPLQLQNCFANCENKKRRTFPSPLPLLSLDRIYAKNVQVLKATILNSSLAKSASDHLPLMVELEV